MASKTPAPTLLQSDADQAEKPSLNLSGKQPPRRTNSWKEFAGRTTGSAGYQMGDWKKGKQREKQQSMLRRQSMEHALKEEDQPGTYIVKTKAILGKGPEVSSEDVQWLAEGSAVHILEVCEDETGKRVRGRVEDPAGWISLRDMESGARWAVRQGGLTSFSSPASPDAQALTSEASSPMRAKSGQASETATPSQSTVRELTFDQMSPSAQSPQQDKTPQAASPASSTKQAPLALSAMLDADKDIWLKDAGKMEMRSYGLILAVGALLVRIGAQARRGKSAALSRLVLLTVLAVAMAATRLDLQALAAKAVRAFQAQLKN